MLPHTAPAVSTAPPSAVPQAEHLNACPIMIPGSSAAKGTRGHTRRRASPRARQTGCPCTSCWWQPVCLDSRPRTSCPRKLPRPVGPQKETVQSEAGCNPHRLRLHRLVTAPFLCSGRMPSAPIVPPGSWPCCPSTLRLSRSSQPSSRRVYRAPRNPLLPATPRGILRSRSAAAPQPTPAKRRAIFINQPHHNNQPKTPHPKTV